MMIGGRFDGGFGLLAVVMWIVWIAIVVGLVVLLFLAIRWLVRQGSGSQPGSSPAAPPASAGSAAPRPDDPLEILRQRYARGEIDDEEFERRRRTLGG